jgi:hypothetical protein
LGSCWGERNGGITEKKSDNKWQEKEARAVWGIKFTTKQNEKGQDKEL